MTLIDPGFAAAVRMARRALDERIAARARELQRSIGVGADPAPVPATNLPPAKRVPRELF
jgi:hypothetical protein